MTALYVIGIIALVFVLIGSLRATVTVEYSGEVRLCVKVLFFKIKILPAKKKKAGPFSMSKKKAEKIRKSLRKKAQKKKEKAEKKRLQKEEKKRKKESGELPQKKKISLSQILDLISLAKDVLCAVISKFFGHLRVDVARLRISIGTPDAATTAMYYGIICDALTHLLPLLEGLKGFDLPKSQDISVETDFLSEEIRADVKISVSLRVWHVFHVIFAAIGKAIKGLFRMMKNKAQREN